MTSASLTESWTSVQKLVEDLRPLMLKVHGATDSEFVGLRPELMNRLQAVGDYCRLAKEASNALTKVASHSVKGSASPPPQTVNATTDSRTLQSLVQQQASQTGTALAPQHTSTAPQQAAGENSAPGQSSNPHADDRVPRFPFSIVKPRPDAQTHYAITEAAQPPKSYGGLPTGAVAMSVPQSVPLATLPSANAVNAHVQAALEPLVAQKATDPQVSAAQMQTVQPNSSRQPKQSAVLAQFNAEKPRTLVPHADDSSGLQPALPTVKVDLDNTGHLITLVMKAETVTSSTPLPPGPRAAAQKDSAALMSMLSSGKRLREVVSQEANDPAQHKDDTESLNDPLLKKPKGVSGQ